MAHGVAPVLRSWPTRIPGRDGGSGGWRGPPLQPLPLLVLAHGTTDTALGTPPERYRAVLARIVDILRAGAEGPSAPPVLLAPLSPLLGGTRLLVSGSLASWVLTAEGAPRWMLRMGVAGDSAAGRQRGVAPRGPVSRGRGAQSRPRRGRGRPSDKWPLRRMGAVLPPAFRSYAVGLALAGGAVRIRGVGQPISPGLRRERRGGPCLGAEHCARTRRKRDRVAASPARCPGAAAARSAARTTSLPWC